MAFCASCGQEMISGAAFCPKCGAPTGAAAPAGAAAPTSAGSAQAPAAGLEENIAGLLCYVLGWLTGLIFLIIDKRPFVRFHAMQSLITFGGLHLIYMVLMAAGFAGAFAAGAMGGMMMGGIWALVHGVLTIAWIIAWVLCMVKAYQGQRYKLPVVGDMAEKYSQ